MLTVIYLSSKYLLSTYDAVLYTKARQKFEISTAA